MKPLAAKFWALLLTFLWLAVFACIGYGCWWLYIKYTKIFLYTLATLVAIQVGRIMYKDFYRRLTK